MNKETLRMQMLAGIITESQYKVKLTTNSKMLNENFDLSNDKWRNWAISKSQGLKYDDLSGYERNFVDKISDYINKNFGSDFDRVNKTIRNRDTVLAGFDKKTLGINGLDRKDIEWVSELLAREFGKDKFITVDASGTHFIKLEYIIGNFYKLVLNPLYIEKYEKEALQFHDQYNKERS